MVDTDRGFMVLGNAHSEPSKTTQKQDLQSTNIIDTNRRDYRVSTLSLQGQTRQPSDRTYPLKHSWCRRAGRWCEDTLAAGASKAVDKTYSLNTWLTPKGEVMV